MTTILVLEDDEALGRQVVDHLKKAGFSVVWWKTGRLISEDDLTEVSLIVLDLMLPNIGGLDILKNMREHSDVPVLVLSARQDSHDKVRALQLGADDYLTKPFWPEEMVERVWARLRRPVMQRSAEIKFANVAVDADKRELKVDGQRVDVTKAELDILLALTRKMGQPVSRSWLLMHVLDPEREGTERTLDVHVSRLRKKLGDSSLIETVWGIGYRLKVEPS